MKTTIDFFFAFLILAILILTFIRVYEGNKGMPPAVQRCMFSNIDLIRCDKSYDIMLSYCRSQYDDN